MKSGPRSIALALVPGTLFAGMAGGIVFPVLPIVGTRVALWLVPLERRHAATTLR